jgi:hypothetical protein
MTLQMDKYSFFKVEKENDIICVEFSKDLKIDEDIASKLVSDRINFTKDLKYYYVIDLSNIKQITPEARHFMQNSQKALANILGVAFIASNPVSTLLANIFVKTEKKFPAKFFNKMTEAIDWIIELKKN